MNFWICNLLYVYLIHQNIHDSFKVWRMWITILIKYFTCSIFNTRLWKQKTDNVKPCGQLVYKTLQTCVSVHILPPKPLRMRNRSVLLQAYHNLLSVVSWSLKWTDELLNKLTHHVFGKKNCRYFIEQQEKLCFIHW